MYYQVTVVQSNFPIYSGKNVVRDNEDILIVSFNYRLNILGFPNAPQLLSNEIKSQNFGFLDLDTAVQWVYDNIAGFGGDPERITLFGQSAGGIAIDAYTFAHPQDIRVRGVIEQSGNLHVESSIFPEPTSQSWATVASMVGCGNGATFFSDTPARAAAGTFLRVPLLLGSTQNEADFIGVSAEIATGFTVLNFVEILDDLATLTDFTCPVGLTALDRVNAKGPTWRYEYQAVFPDISPRPDLRAYHTSELPVVFGTFTSPTGTEKALSRFIQSAWVAFARDPAHGLQNIGWSRYSPNTTTLAQIGGVSNQTGITLNEGRLLDFACNSTETLGDVEAQLITLLGPIGGGFGL
ncbi:Para-nitrobenzyl esterase [Termitomyces sp. T112]|nr:Para-nitrobenzyl esterase [Termitomyces sp. T112]